MAAKTMADYLSVVTPDNDTEMVLSAQVNIEEDYSYLQEVHIAADGSEERIDLSNETPDIRAMLQFPRHLEADIGTIVDFYNDFSKGGGVTKSFKWEHTTDGNMYVIRFDQSLKRFIYYSYQGVTKMKIRVLGNYS